MTSFPMSPCQRPSCPFPRKQQTTPDGKSKLPRYCSADCSVYMIRARRALRRNDGVEAAELVRLWDALNARKRPTDHIDEVFARPDKTG
ncbi:hypothetical protein [Streptomyces fuscichromogenes]|uniref:Uncharacterized protein n=1 Tax=Streptomyces fuscichromogenes TaxID=1324013 RepID=A0A918CW65_9ACTN|nr:hypothetical protein [Streptomyces fuscichromogenes]GGN38147.1 hypothetical protein GCM10011578_083210 [Streptomyces fuscichromogenes]